MLIKQLKSDSRIFTLFNHPPLHFNFIYSLIIIINTPIKLTTIKTHFKKSVIKLVDIEVVRNRKTNIVKETDRHISLK